MMTNESGESIPFSFFVSLLREISRVEPRSSRDSSSKNTPRDVFVRWVANLRRRFTPLPQGTAAAVLLLLFPEEDSRRKYGMQETKLAQELAKCFGVSMKGRGDVLNHWNGEASTGCLGAEICKIANSASSLDEAQIGPLSIADVQTLLDELASTSAFSDRTLRQSHSHMPRSKNMILRDLYQSMPSVDAAFLTQIILKDIRPLLYPLSETHYTAALTKYNSKAVLPLTKEAAMMTWDPTRRLLRTHSVRSNLYDATHTWEQHSETHKFPEPQIGSAIEIPKSVKGRGCLEALKHFANSERVWAETKYDGERAQIHVEIREDGMPHITIFSKSKRDSTLDRWGVHGIVRNALGLGNDVDPGAAPRKIKNIILDAELVAFTDRHHKVDEFWRIRSLITATARGVRSRMFVPLRLESQSAEEGVSQASLASNASDSGTRHLALIFFDVLVLDSTSLLSTPYESRRSLLESLIQTTPGYAMLAERHAISLNGPRGIPGAAEQLRSLWATNITDCEEGLVLKAADGFYNHYRSPWVKLKKDYIPGYGDTVDLVILGTSWEKERGRELRVAPGAYTTFYVGGLANACALRKDPSIRPHFECYFTASYGLTREQLEEANFLIKSSDPIRYNPQRKVPKGLPYTYDIYSGLSPPAVIFQEPLLAELYGAGFTKSPKSTHYELRFPRLVKLYRPSERSWADGVALEDLHKIAREAVGRDRSSKGMDDWTKDLWGQQSSPGVKCEKKRKSRTFDWIDKLEVIDSVKTKRAKILETSSRHAGSGASDHHDSRLALGTKALGPLLNMTSLIPTPPASSPEPLEQRPHRHGRKTSNPTSPPTTPVRHAGPFVSSPLRDLRYSTTGSPSSAARRTPAIPTPIPSLSFAESESPKHSLPAGIRGSSLAPVGSFLENKFVWFARPCNTLRSPGQPSTRELLSGAARLHSLESLLLGCAWEHSVRGYASGTPSRAGVIFIDQSTPEGKDWGKRCLAVLEEKTKTSQVARRSIWVFETTALSLDMFKQMDVDPEGLALQRFD
ncbi:hypothetical protein FIBSPDRAFT_788707 [Athelia psychrophila]|uniref:ATP-dependent DNA ligase family profile domain-containing protein n=1 Tax=Athelia psychrophila TaxID=1759441 RepID=A0A166JNP5_9AGAM|nr:hypothetical protein FIBSPDRAFT_788707 [Fibularhizoctonia sp. CBS 109695]